jgi:hypothetical protein
MTKNSKKKEPPDPTMDELVQFYRRNGYLRLPDEDRQQSEGPRNYKKGYEIRFVAMSKKELATIRRLLKTAGFKPGNPFPKVHRYVQPVYGREATVRFYEVLVARGEI